MPELSTAASLAGSSVWRAPYRGFTLIELMIGLVLLSVLLSIGVPMFQSFILDQRSRAISIDLSMALMTARSEAVKRNRRVELKPTDDDWGIGWTISTIPDVGETGVVAEVLNEHVQTGDVTISGPDSPAQVEFSRSGRVAAQAVFEVVIPDRNDKCRFVQLELDGHAVAKKEDCTGG